MNLGVAYSGLGQHADALDHHQRALAIAQDTGLAQAECEILNEFGQTLLATGSAAEALDKHKQALKLAKKTEAARQAARAHDGIAQAAFALGDRE